MLGVYRVRMVALCEWHLCDLLRQETRKIYHSLARFSMPSHRIKATNPCLLLLKIIFDNQEPIWFIDFAIVSAFQIYDSTVNCESYECVSVFSNWYVRKIKRIAHAFRMRWHKLQKYNAPFGFDVSHHVEILKSHPISSTHFPFWLEFI